MEITTKQEQRTACIRIRTTLADLPGHLGAGYGEIMSSLGRQGVQPVGAPFAIYYNMDMNDLDVEMGFPVAAPFREEGRMKPGSIPGGRTAVTTHRGPYNTMEKTYNGLTAFIAENKAVPTGLCYEVYMSDPQNTKPEDMLTEINFPLRD
jgi:effector-binding domain-containing protein